MEKVKDPSTLDGSSEKKKGVPASQTGPEKCPAPELEARRGKV